MAQDVAQPAPVEMDRTVRAAWPECVGNEWPARAVDCPTPATYPAYAENECLASEVGKFVEARP